MYSCGTSIFWIPIENVHEWLTDNETNEQKLKIIWSPRAYTSAENYSTRTKFKLNMPVLMTHLYFEFQLKISRFNRDNEWKLKIIRFSLSPRGHNCAKNRLTGTNFELDLRILMTKLYTEFQFKMSTWDGDNEQTLKIIRFFLSSTGIILPKIV